MKTVEMDRDWMWVSPNEQESRGPYEKGQKYERVTEAIAEAIVKAGAGRVVGGDTAVEAPAEQESRRGRSK